MVAHKKDDLKMDDFRHIYNYLKNIIAHNKRESENHVYV